MILIRSRADMLQNRPLKAEKPPSLALRGTDANFFRTLHLVFTATRRRLRLKIGAPDRIRTCDLRLRRPTLYPAELRAPMIPSPFHCRFHCACYGDGYFSFSNKPLPISSTAFGGQRPIQLSYGCMHACYSCQRAAPQSQIQPNSSWASSSASISASTSARVLYMAKDARHVAVTPR